MLIDCHVHLTGYSLADLPPLIERATRADVHCIITAGTTLDSCRQGIQLAERFPTVYAGVGIHPRRVTGPVPQQTYEELRRLALSSPKVVVLSETGLDFGGENVDRPAQEQAFREQIRLARDLRLPIVWHSWLAHLDVLRILREEQARDVGGVMHYFQSDETSARAAIDEGFLISFARPLLRFPHLQELAPRLPLESIVLETDCSPQPWKESREDWTEPRHVAEVAGCLAHLRGITMEEVAQATTANMMRLLRLPVD